MVWSRPSPIQIKIGPCMYLLRHSLCIWQQVDKVTGRDINVLSSSTAAVDTARDLDVLLDSQLTMSAHVSDVCRSAIRLAKAVPTYRTVSHEATSVMNKLKLQRLCFFKTVYLFLLAWTTVIR